VVQNGLSKEVLKMGLRTVPAAQLLPLACQQEQYDWLTAKCYKWVKHCYIQIKSTQYIQNYQRRCKCGPCTHTQARARARAHTHTHTHTHIFSIPAYTGRHSLRGTASSVVVVSCRWRVASVSLYVNVWQFFCRVVVGSCRVVKCESTFKRQPSHSNDGHSKEGGVLDGSGNEYRVQGTKKHKSIGRVQPPRPKRKPERHEFVKSVQQ
jgi:hypothetical protein